MRRSLSALIGALLASGCGDSPQEPPTPSSSLEAGRLYTGWFYSGDLAPLWSRFSPQLRGVFGSVDGLRAFRGEVRAQAGTERAVRAEQLIPWLGSTLYARSATFSRTPGPVLLQWDLGPTGTVLGMLVTPLEEPAPSRFLDYRTRATLRLPFAGEWFVFWGGRSVVENYHAVAADQRFAYDFVVARGGRTHAGDAARNESYFCFGEPILAPADGTVVAAVDGIPDNPPGTMNADQPPGNHVVLDHGGGEFSFLAHLQERSVSVRARQTVRAGEPLGRCGNSGNSSEPHLHYHLQTTPVFGEGAGLPAQFGDYRADGEPVARGEPSRGETIAPR